MRVAARPSLRYGCVWDSGSGSGNGNANRLRAARQRAGQLVIAASRRVTKDAMVRAAP